MKVSEMYCLLQSEVYYSELNDVQWLETREKEVITFLDV